MGFKNLYQVLGVQNFANPEVVKSAFWQLAKRYHPDTSNTDYYANFLEIKNAYELLSNQEKKKAYDEELENELNPIKRRKQYKIRADKDWIKKYKTEQLKNTKQDSINTKKINQNKSNHWQMILISVLISLLLILIMIQ